MSGFPLDVDNLPEHSEKALKAQTYSKRLTHSDQQPKVCNRHHRLIYTIIQLSIIILSPFLITGSPFRPVITDTINPSKVTASGPGLDPNGVRHNTPTQFRVDATQAGKAPLEVIIIPERGR